MGWLGNLSRASGLTVAEANEIDALCNAFRAQRRRNARLERYYEGDVGPRSIGPDTMLSQVKLDVDLSCDWPRKAVHSLSSLVKFDGFVFGDGLGYEGAGDELDATLRDCGFESAFARHKVGMLKKGCMFATVGTDDGGVYVRFHSADTATAIIDTTTERIRSGMCVAASGPTEWSPKKSVPTQVNVYGRGWLLRLDRTSPSTWAATHVTVPDGVCMMVAMGYRPTDTKPLGSSRITKSVMDLTDDVLHLRQVLVLSSELYAIPMRYIVGLTAGNMEALKENPKWTLYLNPVFTATRDAKSGKTPELGQLPANSPAAILELIYADAKMFAGATGVPLNSLGIVQDNPNSAEAIAEGRKDLTDEAQDLIDGQLTPAFREIALLVMMVTNNVSSPAELDDARRSVMPKFRNPAMPSISASTDAAMKIASVMPEFANTRTFFEMTGMDGATITRTLHEMRLNRMRANTPSLLGNTLGMNQQRQQGAIPDGNLLNASEGDDASDIAQ